MRGAAAIGAERRVRRTLCDILFHRPQDCIVVIGILRHICKRICGCGRGFSCRTPQEGHALAAGHGIAGAEGCWRSTLHDTFFHCPQDCLMIIGICGNVGKGTICGGRFGRAHCSPKEGDRLRTGANFVRAECGACCATCDAFFNCPQHCVMIIALSATSTKGCALCTVFFVHLA